MYFLHIYPQWFPYFLKHTLISSSLKYISYLNNDNRTEQWWIKHDDSMSSLCLFQSKTVLRQARYTV